MPQSRIGTEQLAGTRHASLHVHSGRLRRMTEWFKQWFGEEYHDLYAHRDEADARRVVALIRNVVPWSAGDRILDLACGPGRHAAALAHYGGGGGGGRWGASISHAPCSGERVSEAARPSCEAICVLSRSGTGGSRSR